MSVKVSYIPNILKYKGRKIEVMPYSKVEGKTILDCVKILGYPTENIKAIINGKKVSLDSKVEKNTEVIITPDVKWPAIVAIWNIVMVIAAVYAVISTIIALVNKPRKPNYGTTGEGIDEGSATYGWEGIRTIQEVGTPIPVIYGRHRVGGNVINAYVRTDGNKNYLNVLLALSEGEINSIGTILINDNPSANFDGISTTTKMGTNDQAMIPNFEDAHNLYDVNTNLTKDNAHVYTTADSDVEGFEIHLQCPGGLFQQDSGGGIKEWSVTYQVEYKLHAAPAYTDLGSTTITAKSRTTIRRVFRKTGLTAGQYDIRVTRTSDDSSLDPLMEGDLSWVQLDEIKLDDFRYPNTALLGIEALATDQLSGGMPNFTSLVEGIKVSVPDIRTAGDAAVDWEDYYWNEAEDEFRLLDGDTSLVWDDVTYVDLWSANPIWCIKDLLINDRYGLGEFIVSADIDNTLFLEMAKYCEEKVPDGEGGYEKRFHLNVVLDSSTRALDLLLQLCMSFRGMLFYSAGNVKIRIDKNETPIQLFTMGNIIKDSFKQSWKSLKDVPNVVEIQYLDEDKDYKQDTIAYIDEAALAAGDPVRKKTIRLFVTKISQVIREARYALKQAKYLNRAISFGASIDALACQPGDLISVQHDVPQWGFGGRVKTGSTTTKVVLDQEVTLAEGTYKIRVHHNDDTIEEKTVSTGAGTTDEIEVVGDDFGFTPAAFDKYAIGLSGSVKKDFRIISMKIDNKNDVEITAMEHDMNVYDDSAITIPDNNYSALTLTIPIVRNLALTERIAILADGTIENVIDVWWDKPSNPSSYVRTYLKAAIYISEDNINWRYVGDSYGNNFAILGDIIKGVTYYVAVVSVTDANIKDSFTNAPSDNIVITSTPSAPVTVTNFAYTFNDEIDFTWDKNAEGNIAGYEIRVADSNWGVDNADLSYRGLVTRWTEIRPAARSGTTYYIKAYSTSGIYADTAASVTPTNDAPAAPSLSKIELFQKSFLSWDDVADKDLKFYEVWTSATDAWAGEESLFTKVIGRVIAGTGIVCLVNVPTNPTYFKVRGVDNLGAGTFSNSISVSTVQIVTADIAVNAITASQILADSITANKYHELRNTYIYNAIDSLDDSYSLEVPFKIVSELLTVQSVKLSFKILEFRAYAKTVASGGGDTSGAEGSASGGADTSGTTASASGGAETSGQTGGSHTHTIALTNSASGTALETQGGEFRVFGGGTVTTSTVDGHSHTFTMVNNSGTQYVYYTTDKFTTLTAFARVISSVTDGHTHSMDVVGVNDYIGNQMYYSSGTLRCSGGGTITLTYGNSNHTHTTPAHTHPNHQHTTPDHTHPAHTHTTPDHAHTLGFGIFEDVTSPNVHYHIDNVGDGSYGAASGSYNSDQTDLDITASISGAGWKAIRFDTDARCRIAAIVEVKLDISA